MEGILYFDDTTFQPTNQPPIDTLVSPTHLHGRYLNINTTSNQPIQQLLGQLRKLVVSSDTIYLQQKITGCTLHLIPLSEAKKFPWINQ